LAKGLGGTIDVKSSVGVGTVVEICLPAAHEIAPPTAIESTPLRSTFDEQLYGRTLCLVTAEAYRRLTKTTSGTNDKPDRSAVVERAIRASACEFWGMKLVVASDASLPRADIYVLDSECFRDLVQDGVGNAVVFLPSVSPLLLLCSGAGAPVCSSLDGIKNYVHLHHPISPKKVRSAISALNASWGKDLGVVTSDGPPLAPIRVPPVPAPQKTFLAGGAEATKEGATPGITAGLPPPKQTTLHLLLVDDNPINIKILETTVRRLKHTFASAYDGLEAVQLYKKALDEQRPFDMVWMDLQMPKMDGFEAIREIRDLEISVGSKACSMIALTGLSSDEHRNQAMASGASDFLTKPVKMGIIKGMLDDQLQKRDV
jgi:CheY-like chemotaxis protein